MASALPLPDYAPMLRAYHAGFAAELGAMVGSLPIAPGDRVLDCASGDGAYLPLLRGRVGPSGLVVGLDLSPAYLAAAAESGAGDEVALVAGALERPPFPAGSFDAVWSAQSLFSLPEPAAAIARMAAAARPGGLVAVLEDDTLHQVLLPWPVDLELAVRVAERAALAEQSDHPRKFYVGRQLVALFRAAGLVDIRARTFASDRQAPLDPDTRAFLAEYLKRLGESVRSRLTPERRAEFDRLADPASPDFLLDSPDFAATVVDRVVWGRRPGPESGRPESP